MESDDALLLRASRLSTAVARNTAAALGLEVRPEEALAPFVAAECKESRTAASNMISSSPVSSSSSEAMNSEPLVPDDSLDSATFSGSLSGRIALAFPFPLS